MSYISGPAILKIGANYYFFKDGLEEKIDTQLDATKDDTYGTVARHLKSRKITLSGTPTAMRRNLASLFPYALGDIGKSVMTLTPELYTLHGQKIAYGRGGLTKACGLMLAATKDLFTGNMEFTMLGKLADAGTTADHFRAITDVAFPNGAFDDTKIRRYRYTAAYGDDPYDAMTAQEGFGIEVNYATEEIPDDTVGIGDIVLKSIECSAKFIPSLLTEAQIDTLIGLQDADALLPGDTLGLAPDTDLVITGGVAGDGFIVTLPKAGFGQSALAFKTGKLRAGEVMAVNRATFNAGAPDVLISMEEFVAP